MESYPLKWPAGKPRTEYPQRSRFGERSIIAATNSLLHQIRLLSGSAPIVSTNLKLRLDGLPYSSQAQPRDTGVAVYYTHRNKQMCFACDRWDRIQDNIYAISMTIEALRGISRWGSGDMVQQAFTGFTALPTPPDPWEFFGIRFGASHEVIDQAYRNKARDLNSKGECTPEKLMELNIMRDRAKRAS